MTEPIAGACPECGKRVDPNVDQYVVSYRCPDGDAPPVQTAIRHDLCDVGRQLDEYRATGVITTKLMMWATLAEDRLQDNSAFNGLRLRAGLWDFYQLHKESLLRIAADVKVIHAAERRFEANVWLKHLQNYYRGSDTTAHSGRADNFKALLMGSAGRVLLTLADAKPNDPLSMYLGAGVTLIFDEDSPVARGGVQGIRATIWQALGLIREATERFPVMGPDKGVGFGF